MPQELAGAGPDGTEEDAQSERRYAKKPRVSDEDNPEEHDGEDEPPRADFPERQVLSSFEDRLERQVGRLGCESLPALAMLPRLLGVEEKCPHEAERADAPEEEETCQLSRGRDVDERPERRAPQERVAGDA